MKDMDHHQCETCACMARYTTAAGKRACALCAMGVPSVRDIDLPDLLKAVNELCDELDKQQVTAGATLRLRVRGFIGLKPTFNGEFG